MCGLTVSDCIIDILDLTFDSSHHNNLDSTLLILTKKSDGKDSAVTAGSFTLKYGPVVKNTGVSTQTHSQLMWILVSYYYVLLLHVYHF